MKYGHARARDNSRDDRDENAFLLELKQTVVNTREIC
jgi:hypothetical protein